EQGRVRARDLCPARAVPPAAGLAQGGHRSGAGAAAVLLGSKQNCLITQASAGWREQPFADSLTRAVIVALEATTPAPGTVSAESLRRRTQLRGSVAGGEIQESNRPAANDDLNHEGPMTGLEVRNEGIQSDYNAEATVDKKSYGDQLNI